MTHTRCFLPLAVLIAVVAAPASGSIPPAAGWFPPESLATMGVYYYPEHWDRSEWDRDFGNIAAMGFEFVHMGEFAWTFFEPAEGVFEFTWMDEAIRLARRHGLQVLLGTPSAAPPVWLAENHPEVLMTDESGTVMRHGSRQQISWSSEKYRYYVSRITGQLARRYGSNPAVCGWQIDNEPSHYGRFDYSKGAAERFRRWLNNKYHTIAQLNAAWGTAFWSIRYQSFDQVRIPNQRELVQQVNPHAVLDFKRFTADEAASFVRMQAEVLRQHIPSHQWITTNYMPTHTMVDPRRESGLDFPTYTMYPVSGYVEGPEEQGFRIGSPWMIAFANDMFRPIKGVSGVMEMQPGQVNWGTHNYQPFPGAVRLWLWHAFSGNLSLLCSYRFRQPLFGYEMYHNGMVGTDGVTLSRGGKEYQTFIEELHTLRRHALVSAGMPSRCAARKTGLLWNPDNVWDTEYMRETIEWDEIAHVQKYHSILKTFGAPVDIVGEDADFTSYPFLIAPAYQLLDSALVDRWTRYVAGGGHLVLTCRTGQKNRDGQLWKGEFARPITGLIGARVEFFDLLAASHCGTVSIDTTAYVWQTWADVLQPAEGTHVLARYEDQFYKGSAAAVTRRLGRGTVTYIGADSPDGRFEEAMLLAVFARAGVAVEHLPPGVLLEWRDGFWIALNYSSSPRHVPISEGAKILIGTQILDPAQVAVWCE